MRKPRIQAIIQDAVTAGLLPKQPLETRLAVVIGTQPPPPTSASLMTKTQSRQSCMSRTRPMRSVAANNWRAAGTWRRKPDSASSPCQDEDSEDMDFSAPRKSRLGAPQLQAQLSRLTDRTPLRRLKSTLLSNGAWQQVTRIEDLCHTSQKWLYHLDACAGSVLTPHDYNTNVQKRLGTVRLLPGPTTGTQRNLQHHRSYARTLRIRSRCGVRTETRGPRHHFGTQRAHSIAILAG